MKSDLFSKITSFYPLVVSILTDEKILLYTSIVSVIISIIYTIIRIIVYLRFNRGKLAQNEFDFINQEIDKTKNEIEGRLKND